MAKKNEWKKNAKANADEAAMNAKANAGEAGNTEEARAGQAGGPEAGEAAKAEEELNAEAAAAMAEEIAEAAAAEQEAGEEKPNDEAAQWKDKYVRQVAEFDNFRKRTEKEKAAMFDMGAMHVLEKLLGTVDNFERGLKDAPEDAFGEGMKMIYKELQKMMDELDVKPIEAVGQEFDPNLHNAVMHEEDDSGEENIITAELQKGYKYKDHILRYSMVKVKN